jgi:hypothetical protein
MVETPLARFIKRHSKIVDESVKTFFEPIARKYGFPLLKIRDGTHEMPSPYFILRIELDVECDSGLIVSLRRVTMCDFIERFPGIQYGITWFAPFSAGEIKHYNSYVVTDEDFLKKARILAEMTERFGIPYLLGQKNDFEAIKQLVESEGEPRRQKIREMQRNIERNLKNVRQEWPVVIPREKGEEWETAKEIRNPSVQFLGELDGEKEKNFKKKLAEFFARDRSVNSAYLARIIGYGIPATAALCLRTQFGSDKGMMEKIGKIFAHVFDIEENLNVIFLTVEQESSLAKVCQPFFG